VELSEILTRALNSVDFPTLGSPTMPLFKAMLTLPQENRRLSSSGTNLCPMTLEYDEETLPNPDAAPIPMLPRLDRKTV